MSQRENFLELIIKFCNERGNKTFSLKELNNRFNKYDEIGIGGKTPEATVRRLLQELRDESHISFLDKSGNYTLRGVLLESEKEDIKNLDISRESPDKKEYLIETYARKSTWVKQAKKMYGLFCMMDLCKNTFTTIKQEPYIEVHHIIPLNKGGEDGVWNLSVLCAHHHKMAHFAVEEKVNEIQNFLLLKVEKYGINFN